MICRDIELCTIKLKFLFQQESTNPTYKKLFDVLQKNPAWYTSSNDEGVAKVLKENYAFFMESTSIE